MRLNYSLKLLDLLNFYFFVFDDCKVGKIHFRDVISAQASSLLTYLRLILFF